MTRSVQGNIYSCGWLHRGGVTPIYETYIVTSAVPEISSGLDAMRQINMIIDVVTAAFGASHLLPLKAVIFGLRNLRGFAGAPARRSGLAPNLTNIALFL